MSTVTWNGPGNGSIHGDRAFEVANSECSVHCLLVDTLTEQPPSDGTSDVDGPLAADAVGQLADGQGDERGRDLAEHHDHGHLQGILRTQNRRNIL